jgi:ATP-dependent 26S proteasome regulatory subunit
MTGDQSWHEANGAFLAAALRWLRACLERCADAQSTAGRAGRGSGPVSDETVSDREVRLAAEAMELAAGCDPPPALFALARGLGLSRFERDVLLLCAAMELDTRTPALCAAASGDPHKPYPTFALAMMAFDQPAWEALSPRRPLRYWKLLEVAQGPPQPLTGSLLRIDERIASYIKGLNELDDRVLPLLVPANEPLDGVLAPSQGQAVDRIVRALSARGLEPVVELVGPDPGTKRIIAGCAARGAGLHLLRLSAELLPLHLAEIDALGRLCHREAQLLPIMFCLEADDVDGAGGERVTAVRHFLARCAAPLVLSAREPWTGVGRPIVSFEVEKPTRLEQAQIWRGVLDAGEGQLADLLSSHFSLDAQSIKQIGASLEETAGARAHEIWTRCRQRVRPRLDSLAQRIRSAATWDDLVLPDEQMQLLRQIAAQVTHRTQVYEQWELGTRVQRGLGISALFAGESGTGKTLAAEVLANHLDLNLYRIDLSSVINKYIGETEKNLRRLFDAAEDGGCILFFDEADALFGKRTEVKDSHDRFANIEINYLLQRMEAYRGLAILATNLRNTLDAAFVRRLRFIVSFPFPSLADRGRLWARVFPERAPVAPLDHGRLARLGLTGAAIRNVAVNAAFLAAGERTAIDMGHVLRAAKSEFAKLERPINVAEFNWQPAEAVR